MLQKIGDSLKGSKTLAYVLGIPLILVFALWGAAGIVDMDLFGTPTWAAKANGEKIGINDVQDRWRDQQSEWQQRFGTEIPDAAKPQLQDSVLEQFVRAALLRQRTTDLGYRISTSRVRAYLEGLPAFQIDGKFDPQIAKAALAQRGIPEAKFQDDLRTDLQNQELQRGVAVSEFLTNEELSRLLALQDEQREVRVATLPLERYTTAAIEPAAIDAWYKAHSDDYMQPESVRLQYADLRLEQVASTAAVAEQDIKDFYSKNRDRYVEPEKRRTRHILITIERGKDADALKKANEVLTEARSGKDFSELARKYSQDAGTARQGGDLGWNERNNGFAAAFNDAVFAMSQDEIKGPVRTEFGYHIIRLDGIQAGKTKSYEDARAEIEAEVRRNKAADDFGARYELVQRELEKPGADIAAVARLAGLTLAEMPTYERGAGGAPLGTDPALQEIVFGDAVLNQKRIGGPVNLGQDRFVIVRALDHRKAAPKPLADVRDAVTAAARKDRATAAAAAAATAAVKRLEAGETLDAVATSLGVKADAARFVGRADPALGARLREAVFGGLRPQPGKPKFYAVTPEQGGAAIVVVSASKLDVDRANAQLLQQRSQLATAESGQWCGDGIY